MQRARFELAILLAASLLGGCALLKPLMGDEAGTDPRGRMLKQRGAAVVVALEQFRTANGGRLPAHLFELVPKYLPQIPDGIATEYRPDRDRFTFSYQPKPDDNSITACDIEIGHRTWNCYYKI